MTLDRETRLWTWLLFHSKVKPAEVKRLLLQWQEVELSAEQAVQSVAQDFSKWGITRELAAQLSNVPPKLPEHPAVRWNDPRYPEGLQRLQEQRRPALLFTKGNANLLQRPIIYLLPGVILDRSQEMTQETIDLMLGGEFVVAAFAGTTQAEILLNEMAWEEGAAILFAASGLDKHTSDVIEQEYISQGRLCLVSPLPPSALANPKWLPLLHSIAATGANGVVATDECRDAVMEVDAQTRVLWLTEQLVQVPRHPQITASDMPAEVLVWSEEGLPQQAEPAPYIPGVPDYASEDRAIDDVDLGPPPTTEEVLDTLTKGGGIPQALRDKLLGKG